MLALITGAASGLGRALALHLSNLGYTLLLCDIDVSGGKSLVEELGSDRAFFHKCDVTQVGDLDQVLKEADSYGGVDVFINNAGLAEKVDFRSDESDKWRRIIDVNLNSVILGTRLGLKYMKERGVIVNIASLAGLMAVELQPVYAASKAGVVNFTRSFRGQGTRVNCVCPSFFKSAMTAEVFASGFEIKEWVSIDLVLDAIMILINDQELRGQVIRITKRKGIARL